MQRYGFRYGVSTLVIYGVRCFPSFEFSQLARKNFLTLLRKFSP